MRNKIDRIDGDTITIYDNSGVGFKVLKHIKVEPSNN